MTDDKDLERQYRKNLMVVASIVLIYSIAGGKMAADLSMFGAKLQFSRPDWLEYAMVAVMCFFWWRHWQVSADGRYQQYSAALRGATIPSYLIGNFKYALDKNVSIKRDSGMIFLVNQRIERQLECELTVGYVSCICAMVIMRSKSPSEPLSVVNMGFSTVGGKKLWPYDLSDLDFQRCVGAQKNDSGIFESVFKVSLRNLPALIIAGLFYRISWLRAAYRLPWFGDAILPSLTTIAALLAYGAQKLA